MNHEMTEAAAVAGHVSAHVDRYVSDHLPPRGDWPELCFDLPALNYPPRLNCAVELLDRMVAAGHGDRVALRSLEASWSYRELLLHSNRIARVLRDELGLLPGNRVLLRGYNSPLLAACWLAVLKAGGIVVTSMPLLRARELRQMITKARIDFALCDVRLLDELMQAGRQTTELKRVLHYRADSFDMPGSSDSSDSPDSLDLLLARAVAGDHDGFDNVATSAEDPALIAFTSGTTGIPKASVHFHRDVLAICDTFPAAMLQPVPEDVFCGTSPLAFTYGLGGMLCFPLRYGASSLLLERPTPALMLQAMVQQRASICFSVPTFWRQLAVLVETGEHDLSHLRHCVSAGEPLPEATRAAWRRAAGKEIIDGLGSTELLHIFISHTAASLRRGAIGHAVPGYRLCVMGDRGQPLPAGQLGRLAVKGPTGCRYLDDERQRSYVDVDAGAGQGWNLTGDTGILDADGYFHFHARSDDMIVSAGYNIAGPEVEAALLQHPAVFECGVVGIPDAERGHIVKAFVVLHPGHAPGPLLAAQLQAHAKQRIAPYKYPREIEFVSELPRTETSKLQRFRLRERGDHEPSR
ncbi:AMP-dependent synthetase and ligase [Sterolibacterium denitrificans]|uniref:AMP-dependent synthetase and ligase n=1 Tax=Sterolibacterium denitrificans TaxID=157592 RepID=A0A7Z7HRI8_9PROT|nr:AMP-binding protein [Sterolibacterium denitrificans]SMB27586.1 AMP-dependent synthetase and ligase [Sterolibacterium denitrificans]